MTVYDTQARSNVDAEWFKERLADRSMSMRKAAKLMNVDPSTISLMVRGLRGISLNNAKALANLLGTTTTEIYRRAGLPLEDDMKESVALVERLAAEGIASGTPDGMKKALFAILSKCHDLNS